MLKYSSVCAIFFFLTVLSNAATINVPADYSTIQECVDSAAAGDTVTVDSGTYEEHVLIEKSIYLIGEDMSFTIIDAGDMVRCITVKSMSTPTTGKISGFTLKNSGTGISGGLGSAGIFSCFSKRILGSYMEYIYGQSG